MVQSISKRRTISPEFSRVWARNPPQVIALKYAKVRARAEATRRLRVVQQA